MSLKPLGLFSGLANSSRHPLNASIELYQHLQSTWEISKALYGRYVSSVRERSVFVMDTKSVVWTIMEMEDAEAQARGPKMKENGRTPL